MEFEDIEGEEIDETMLAVNRMQVYMNPFIYIYTPRPKTYIYTAYIRKSCICIY